MSQIPPLMADVSAGLAVLVSTCQSCMREVFIRFTEFKNVVLGGKACRVVQATESPRPWLRRKPGNCPRSQSLITCEALPGKQ